MSYYGPCQAMLDAGITDPESKAGKDFCTKSCPYPDDCIMVPSEEKIRSRRKSKRASAIRFKRKGMTLKEIAKELKVSVSTVQHYLK